jgi:hypothetical protein
MPKITKAQCEAMGFDWNEEAQKCTMPKISIVTMTLSRGVGCDGPTRVVSIKKKLSLPLRKALLKAGRKRRRSSR